MSFAEPTKNLAALQRIYRGRTTPAAFNRARQAKEDAAKKQAQDEQVKQEQAKEQNLKAQGFQAVASTEIVNPDTGEKQPGIIYSKPDFTKGFDEQQNAFTPKPVEGLRKGETPLAKEAFSLQQEQARRQQAAAKTQQQIQQKYGDIPVFGTVLGETTKYVTSAAASAPIPIEHAVFVGRALVASKETRQSLLKEATSKEVIKETGTIVGRQAIGQNPEGKYTTESVINAALIYGGAFKAANAPKVETTTYGKPQIASNVQARQTFINEAQQGNKAVFGGVTTEQTITTTTRTPIQKILGKQPLVTEYKATTRGFVTGEIIQDKASFDFTGQTILSEARTGRIISKTPVEAKGIEFGYKEARVQAVSTGKSFTAIKTEQPSIIGEVNVPYKTTSFEGKQIRLLKQRSVSSDVSIYEKSSLEKPSFIIEEGSMKSAGVSAKVNIQKKYSTPGYRIEEVQRAYEVKTSPEKVDYEVFYGKELKVFPIEKSNVLSLKGSKVLEATTIQPDVVSSGLPSRYYLEAYKEFYGKEVYPTRRAVKSTLVDDIMGKGKSRISKANNAVIDIDKLTKETINKQRVNYKESFSKGTNDQGTVVKQKDISVTEYDFKIRTPIQEIPKIKYAQANIPAYSLSQSYATNIKQKYVSNNNLKQRNIPRYISKQETINTPKITITPKQITETNQGTVIIQKFSTPIIPILPTPKNPYIPPPIYGTPPSKGTNIPIRFPYLPGGGAGKEKKKSKGLKETFKGAYERSFTERFLGTKKLKRTKTTGFTGLERRR